MSNIIPPLLSNTPPPPPSPEEDDEDEFGDFTGVNYSYGCDSLSLPSSPIHPPKKVSIPNGLDINSNDEKNKVAQIDLGAEKDFQYERKFSESFTDFSTPVDEIYVHKDDIEHSTLDCCHIEDELRENSNISIENYSSISLTVDKNIKIQLDEEYPPDDESKCNPNNSTENTLNQNKVSIQEIFSTSNLENDKNTEFALKSDLNKCTNLPVDGKEISTETYINKDIGLANENLAINESKRDNDFVDESYFQNSIHVDNIEHEFDSVPPIPEAKLSKSSDEDVSEINPQNQIGDNEIMEENVCSFQLKHSQVDYKEVTVSDLRTSQTEGHISTSIHKEEIESKADIPSNISLDNHKEDESCTNDEFCDFAFPDETIHTTPKIASKNEEFANFKDPESVEIGHCEQKVESVINDDDFGDFSFPEPHLNLDKNATSFTSSKEETKNDDFDDFGEFTYTTVDDLQSSSKQDDVAFGSFANFADIVDEPVILTLNEKQAFEKAECILAEIFPVSTENQEDYHYINGEKDDFIFNELKDITESQALTYQWSKSASQNMLLKALNIDARNILYGPSWNPSIPRFAANLGLKPLEPIKTEILTPSVLKSNPSVSTQPPTIEIPTAQFDWNGSGLTNPLDYLEQLVASLDIPSYNVSSNSNNSSSPINDLDDWDVWLQSVSKNPTQTSSQQTDITPKSTELSADQVFTLQPTPIPSKAEGSTGVPSKSDLEQKIDSPVQEFDDFTSYEAAAGPQTHTGWPSIVPLRETYISNDNINSNLNNKELPLDIESWLQPTIVTPELPRKELEIGEEELPNIQTPESTRKNVPVEEIDDDFDDFQMVLPETNDTVLEGGMKTSDILQPVKPEPILPQQAMKNYEFSDLYSFVGPSVSKSEETPSKNALEIDITQENKQDKFEDEDEFTDFHFSTPAPQPIAPKPLTPILEPLKPVLMHPTLTTAPTNQINWPDPGITEDEIRKFEMVFTRPKESKMEEPKREEPRKVKEEPKKLPSVSSIDDDEWSDFVSVQKPSPVHKFHANEKERTSSPDLPLSVLNLGNIQPAKQPIPVITPHGLVQTKLSSNSSLNMSPKTQLKNNTLAMQNKPVYQQPQIHPSIISNQYASQAYNFNSSYFNQNTKAGLNFSMNQQQKSLDEDDWSDFVSSPIPQTTANGYQPNWQDASSHQQSGWTTASPNIITNPGHFVQSGSDLKNKKVNSKKSTIPSISLPELEFIAPKGRTSSSRKK